MIMSGRNISFSGEGEDAVKTVLSSMRDAAFSDTLVYFMLRQFCAESEKNGYSEMEQELIQAVEQLPKILTRMQLSTFGIIEELYMKEATMSLQISFSRGIYAAFQHCFDPNENDTFGSLVIEQLTNSEKMKQFPDFHKNRTLLNELLDELTAELDPFSREHLTAYACAWDERTHGMLRYGYRLGYSAAQSIMLEVDPNLKVKLAQDSWRTSGEIFLPLSLF